MSFKLLLLMLFFYVSYSYSSEKQDKTYLNTLKSYKKCLENDLGYFVKTGDVLTQKTGELLDLWQKTKAEIEKLANTHKDEIKKNFIKIYFHFFIINNLSNKLEILKS